MKRSNGFDREADFTSAVLRELKRIPRVKAWRANSGMRGGIRFGEPGMPDVCGIVGRHGRFFAIELKQPGGAGASEVQDRWISEAIELGALAYVATTMQEAIQPIAEAL